MTRTRMSRIAGSAWRRLDSSDDSGLTIFEMVISMVLMVIFGTIFTTSINLLYSSANKTEALTSSSSQLSSAFLYLDRTVRYSSGVSAPGKGSTSGDWYVEIRDTTTANQVCTQLRVDITAQQLQRRSWTVGTSGMTGLSAWVPIASDVSNGSAASATATNVPFTTIAPTDTFKFQQLKVNLTVGSGGPAAVQSANPSSSTFRALNTTKDTVTSGVCQEAGRP